MFDTISRCFVCGSLTLFVSHEAEAAFKATLPPYPPYHQHAPEPRYDIELLAVQAGVESPGTADMGITRDEAMQLWEAFK